MNATTDDRETQTSRRRPDRRADDGQVMLLAIAYGVLALLLVTAVVSATAVHLERKRLLATADLAALAAADAVDPARFYAATPSGSDPLVELTPTSVRAAVSEHLATSPEAGRLTGLTVVEATTEDGRTARVTLRSLAQVPLISWVTAPWSDGITLQVSTTARAD